MHMRRRFIWLGGTLLLGLALIGWMFMEARSMPIVRTTTVTLPYPPGAPRRPVRIAWITDTHMTGPDNSPERMARVVDLVNAQKPDIILLGGDYNGDHKLFAHRTSDTEVIKPFRRLHAPLGVLAVLGNHDMSRRTHDTSAAIRKGLADAHVRLLFDDAVERGPLAIGGIPEFDKGLADVPGTLDAIARLGGAPILLSHTPDVMAFITPERLARDGHAPWQGLVLTGHTHCGQIALPFYGAIFVPTYRKPRYTCGRYEAHGQTLIVSGGVGTSGVPLRFFAPPDIWIITVRPAG